MAATPQHILAIDDDAIVQEVLAGFLGDGYEVGLATTGADALVKLRREPADLIVLDHRLPDRTGLEILPELRSMFPSLPVIMLTGYGSEWICAAAFKLGVADYLQKPVSAADLVGAVRRVLPSGVKAGESQSASSAPMGSGTALCIPVMRAVGLIQRGYWNQLSLAALARQVGMSKYRLSRRFHEALGVTFREYLLRVRLERAKSLLASRHASITEVAQMVGFGDLPHFDKLFKRYTGVTPSAFRSSAPRHSKK